MNKIDLLAFPNPVKAQAYASLELPLGSITKDVASVIERMDCQQLSGGEHLGACLPVEPSYWQIPWAIADPNDSLIEPIMA